MTMEQRQMSELERKKQRLAELKANRQRANEERTRQLIQENPPAEGSRQSVVPQDVEQLLMEVGVNPQPIMRTPERLNGVAADTIIPHVSPMAQIIANANRTQHLDFSNVQTIAIPLKDAASYSKTTQTDEGNVSAGEFSLGSQEFDYDDDMMNMEGAFRGRTHSHDFPDSPVTADLANLVPGFFGARHQDDNHINEEEAPAIRELSEAEKLQALASTDFLNFFSRASTVLERAIAEEESIFTDYIHDTRGEVVASSDRLVLARVFCDKKWTYNRKVAGISFSQQYPELMAVAYDTNPEAPNDPAGVVLVWNLRFKKQSPEFIFYCQSQVTSITFAHFHQNLLLAGCYSGQICMWDMRITNKKTPINRSPQNVTAHTHPIYALYVVGTHNAHNLVSLSSDGKMCSWNVDNLTQPLDGKELQGRPESGGATKTAPSQCLSFPAGDVNNFIIGCENGSLLSFNRHGGNAAAISDFPGHTATIMSVDFHRAAGAVDFSHLFLTGSADFTVRMWSTKDPLLRFTFETHTDIVFGAVWSPVHPAVFASIDLEGNLYLWNLNEDTEGPVSRIQVDTDGEKNIFNRKVEWAENGQHLCVGDDRGSVHVYDVHESMYVIRSEEWYRFSRVLADIKQSNEDAEEIMEVKARTSNSDRAVSGVSAMAGLNMSPRA